MQKHIIILLIFLCVLLVFFYSAVFFMNNYNKKDFTDTIRKCIKTAIFKFSVIKNFFMILLKLDQKQLLSQV